MLSVVLASIAMLHLHLVALRMAVRRRRDRHAGAGRHQGVGFFALTGLDFNLTAIAALLTLIGYSVNDKVVVYDRMRENMRLYKSMPFREMIDKSASTRRWREAFTPQCDGVPRAAADGDLGRQRGRELRDADGVRHPRRGELVDVHRGADPAVPRRLAPPPCQGAPATDAAVEIIPPEQGRPRKSAS